MEVMRKFQDLVPVHLRKGVIPASWTEVDAAIQTVQAEWEAKRDGSRFFRAREWIRKMGNGMNNHATALKMLPTESEYITIIAGAVSMVIKVRFHPFQHHHRLLNEPGFCQLRRRRRSLRDGHGDH